MGFCIVRGCKSRSDSNNRGRKFHVVPRDVEMRGKWIAAIGRTNLPKSGSVCSRHFLPEDYQLSRSGLSESLLKTAVPSQHLTPLTENDTDNEDDGYMNDDDDINFNAYYSRMDFENETSFDGFSTAIDALELEKEKDLPPLTCVDLFPDPPRLLAPRSDEIQKDDSLADDDDFEGFRTADGKVDDDQTETIDDDLTKTSNTERAPQVSIKNEVARKIQSPPNEPHNEHAKVSATSTISLASAPVSPASYMSSAESVVSSASSSKKSKKRFCRECQTQFRKTRELHEHLKKHVAQPEIRVERLADDNEKVKEYLSSLSTKSSPTHGSLKLKLKQLSSQNFEVVSNEREDKPPSTVESPQIQILKAADIRCKSEVPERIAPDSYPPNVEVSAKTHSFLAPENRYFECPTFDGLDTFTDEMLNTGEATEDLLKKLLENNKESQSFQREPDWPPGANEFISIDSLAPRCSICNMSSSHPRCIYEHKQLTGHDFQGRIMDSIPRTGLPDYSQPRHDNYMHSSHPPHLQHLPPQSLPPLYQMAQMRGNFPGYAPRLNVRQMPPHHPQPSPPPGFHPNQCMMTRTPPPLYRMNGNPPPNYHPAHRFLDKPPDMYGHGPPAPQFMNGNQDVNQDMMRQPIFLKSRLQKAIRGKSQGPANEMPTSPGILTQHTAIRPRFLGPNPQMAGHMQFQRIRVHSPPKQNEPPQKKVKMEQNGLGVNNAPTMPIIQSVHSGINQNDFTQLGEKSKESSPTHSDGSGKGGLGKNPKEVANILATRGITVTHKGKTSFVPMGNKGGNSANASAQEAVQKLQANNSVSIISKKKNSESNANKQQPSQGSEGCGPGGGGNRPSSKFLSCPVITCKETFMTAEGVNRHAFRWHGIPMPNPDRVPKRGIKCKLCHHVCASSEILQEHVRREHEPSVNQIGIPIVDLRNDEVKRKLAALGIFNYVPLTAAGASTSSLAFPVVSVQGAENSSICNLLGLGASSVLSLGPIKSISMRKPSNENK